MKRICIKCKKEIKQNSKIYYTLDNNLLPKPFCSFQCDNLFKDDTILKLEKIIDYIKEEDIIERFY